MGSHVCSLPRGVYPLFFLGRYMKRSFVQYPRPSRISKCPLPIVWIRRAYESAPSGAGTGLSHISAGAGYIRGASSV